jgi:TolB-like protein
VKSLFAFLRPHSGSTELQIGAAAQRRAGRTGRPRTLFTDRPGGGTDAHGKTGIAILPFTDLAPDPDHPYLADGFRRDLAQILSLNPSFAAEAVDVPHTETAVEGAAISLDQNLLAEGAIARIGRRLNVDIQIVECSSGEVLWSDRFSAPLEQVAALQDDIAEAVAGAVSATPWFLLSGLEPAGTSCAAAWALRQAARGLLHDGPNPHCLESAVRLFALSCRMDPLYADAKIGLAETLCLRPLLLAAPDPAADRARRDAVEDAARILSPSHAELPFIRGLKDLDTGRPDTAALELERSVRVPAIMIPARIFLSIAEARSGRARAARQDAARAFRHSGRPGWTALADYARAEAALARGAADDARSAVLAAITAAGGPGAAPAPVLLLHSLLLAGQNDRDGARTLLAEHWPADLPLPAAGAVETWVEALPGKAVPGKRWLDEIFGPFSRGN